MKKINSNSITLLFALLGFIGCKKDSPNNASVSPANLKVYAVASVDGTGTVAFTATADNAVSYFFNFGDGDTITSLTGITNYQYTFAGTNTYTAIVTAMSSTGKFISDTVQIGVYVKNGSGSLVWSDEFNTDGAPDSTKWGYDIGGGGWGNNELEYYTSSSSNVAVKGGNLVITALKENFNGSAYTSARLLTQNKFSFEYGRLEVRAKLPSQHGTWPAIWMLGNSISSGGWPQCGEIDLMEQKGNLINTIYGTIHFPSANPSAGVGSNTIIANAATDYHVYSLDWSPSTIKISVDGQLYFSYANSTSLPFNQNFFILLNLAMGGNFGGTVDSNFSSDQMLVDYVRVYK